MASNTWEKEILVSDRGNFNSLGLLDPNEKGDMKGESQASRERISLQNPARPDSRPRTLLSNLPGFGSIPGIRGFMRPGLI